MAFHYGRQHLSFKKPSSVFHVELDNLIRSKRLTSFNHDKGFKQLTDKKYFKTTAPNGSFQSPYFGERFNVSLFDYSLKCYVYLYVPDNLTVGSKIVVDIDYDITDELWKGTGEHVFISLQSKEKIRNSSYYRTLSSTSKLLVAIKKNAKRVFSVAEDSTEARRV